MSERKELETVEDEPAERCETCRYWKPNTIDGTLDELYGPYGWCRRMPPSPNWGEQLSFLCDALVTAMLEKKDMDDDTLALWYASSIQWPNLERDDWCGEWEAKGGAVATAAKTVESIRARLTAIADIEAELKEEANMLRARYRRLDKDAN